LQADITDPQDAVEVIRETVDRLGRLDTLVNNAPWSQAYVRVRAIPLAPRGPGFTAST
jgi:NAD(P)-dependent dehydrogenase (short-subunit alcohol dehydrogenase family)